MATNITINTTQLAGLLNISEGELVHALRTEGKLNGVPFPPLVGNALHPGRKFNYAKAVKFAELVKRGSHD